MNEDGPDVEDRPDVDVAALGTGCLTGCGTGCVTTAAVLGLAVAAGVDFVRVTPDTIPGWLRFVGFLLGLASYVVIGYFTARAAPDAPHFHALLIGIIFMLIGVLAFVLPAGRYSGQGGPDFWLIVSWLLTIPMTLWGARIWEHADTTR